ncbi:MAG TPA: carotenoid oxygenase family protein [Noviherbaspirillum sp.]|jgi:carotenoid cleavage dioxygenase|uniref:carotenoid oxygenase family protein n=1 Tax=Noviherbaspirillum sp. TaxID=1926288 RepID=UPI002DDD8056|nr:carotenoid oxygenase family protein [Noviherbaspirillum sp.]HEV2608682.1 carotenoid oxygenase family protein [Noviherbaspirillum sp.]
MTFTHHFLNGNFAPVRNEHDFTNLSVVGALPDALAGALYRVGPNPQFDPRDAFYHWFAGDGMVHAFYIGNGKVAYRNRWMRTPKWQLENQAGKALFGTFGNPATSDPAAIGRSTGTANTNIVSHAGRLFALEESHQPFEFDPLTLESKGYQSFGGVISSRFTAHPKPDPETGELHFFAYSVGGPGTTEMQYGILDRECRVARLDAFHAPYASMVHDFVATTAHLVFPITPLTSSMDRAMKGKPLFAWEEERAVHIGVLPKGAEISAMRWLDTDPCHVFHFMNAWESDGKITVYAMQSEMAPGMPYADGRPGEPGKSAARLSRWTIDLSSLRGKVERTVIDDVPAEFPRIDERYAGRYNRYGWYICHADGNVRSEAEDVLYGTLTCHDFTTARRQRYSVPEGDVLSEPVFAPRNQAADEGDGWIMMTAWRAAEQRSDLLVFNATDIATGPIAMVRLPCRIPFGFHGAWIPA